jgi:hypothetical protein
MVMEYGKVFMEIHILESGDIQKLKDMVYILGKMETDMKGSGKYVLSMVKGQIYLTMEMCTQESTRMVSQMEKDNIHGETVKYMLENSEMVSSTEKENGDLERDLNVINMKETILMIKSMGLVFSSGQVGTATRENIRMMRGMDLEK